MLLVPPEDSFCSLSRGRRVGLADRLEVPGGDTHKLPPEGGLEGPVYIVQNELSIWNSRHFPPPDSGPRPRESPCENPPAGSEQIASACGEYSGLRFAAYQPVHGRSPGALSHPGGAPLRHPAHQGRRRSRGEGAPLFRCEPGSGEALHLGQRGPEAGQVLLDQAG